MNFLDVRKGKWVRVVMNGVPGFPWGTEILRTDVHANVYGVTRDGGLVIFANPLGYPLEVEELYPLTFGDLEPGDEFTDGDDVLRKLRINKGLVNEANWEADGIAVDVENHTPYNFSNDDEVERV